MELFSIPEAFTNKLRLSIISALVTGEKNFKELQNFTDATSGNLGAQLVKLEEWGYINCTKEFINRKPQSTYQLTNKGLSEFKGYVELLENVLKGIDMESLSENDGG